MTCDFTILGVNAPTLDYWGMNQAALTQLCVLYNVTDLIDWAPPYGRNWGSLKILLKAVSSYMSRGNFEGELDAWLTRPLVPGSK